MGTREDVGVVSAAVEPSGGRRANGRLTDVRIEHACRQADLGEGGESVSALAARWGVSKRRLRQVLQEYRATGVVPRLRPRGRPPAAPLSPSEVRGLERLRATMGGGVCRLYEASRAQGLAVPKHKIQALAKARGWIQPAASGSSGVRRRPRKEAGRILRGHARLRPAGGWIIVWEDEASGAILAAWEGWDPLARPALMSLPTALHQAHSWNLSVDRVEVPYSLPVRALRPFLSVDVELVSRAPASGPRAAMERTARMWDAYDAKRPRFERLHDWTTWYNGQPSPPASPRGEAPGERFQRAIPPESVLGLHLRLVERGSGVAATPA